MQIHPVTPEELKAYLDALPVDDEPLTEEDRAAIEEGLRDVANGDTITTAELERRLAEHRAKQH